MQRENTEKGTEVSAEESKKGATEESTKKSLGEETQESVEQSTAQTSSSVKPGLPSFLTMIMKLFIVTAYEFRLCR